MQGEISTLLLYNKLEELRRMPNSGVKEYEIDTCIKQLDKISAVFIKVDIDDRGNVEFQSDDASADEEIRALNNNIRNRLQGNLSRILFNNDAQVHSNMMACTITDSDLKNKKKISTLMSLITKSFGAEDAEQLSKGISSGVDRDIFDDDVSYNYSYMFNKADNNSALLLYKEALQGDTYSYANFCGNLLYDRMNQDKDSIMEIKEYSSISYTINREDLRKFLSFMCDTSTIAELDRLSENDFILSAVSLLKQEAIGQITAYNSVNSKEELLRVSDVALLDGIPMASIESSTFSDSDNIIARSILYYTIVCINKKFES